jgi:hypothetical protein
VPLSFRHTPCHQFALPFHSLEDAVRATRGVPARVEPRPTGARNHRLIVTATAIHGSGGTSPSRNAQPLLDSAYRLQDKQCVGSQHVL